MKKTFVLILSLMLALSTPVMAYEETDSAEPLETETAYSMVFDDKVSEFGYQGYRFVDENGIEVEPQYYDISLFSDFPPYYRNTNVTPVKNQNEEGCCWAFAMIGAMEASLIKQGYDADKLDFSEAHLAYFGVNIRDNIHNDGSESIGADAYSRGGNEYYALAAMAKGSGVVSESVAPYEEYTKNTKTGTNAKEIDESKRFLSEAGIKELRHISPDNIMAIKQAIINYGSVLNSFYYSSTYYNTKSAAYYCSDDIQSNHQTLIVGWDDNFPRENFKDGNQPENDGAWIVRNSWGENYGDGGYIYISYESCLETITAIRAFMGKQHDNNYGYMGGCGFSYYTSYPTVYSAVFGADSDEVLEAISFFAMSPEEVMVSVYKNPTNSPSSGALVFRGTVQMTGEYHKIYFPQGIEINSGESYSIVVDGAVLYVEPNDTIYTANEGSSFVYSNGWFNSNDVSIRAHTNENKPKINSQIRNNTIEVESKYNDNATVYIAQYNGNELIDIKIATEATINTNATKYRIFSWDTDMTSTTGYFVEDEI